MEGVPLQRGGAVGEHEQAVLRDCGHAVEGEVRAGEAVEGEQRRLFQRGHEVVKRARGRGRNGFIRWVHRTFKKLAL